MWYLLPVPLSLAKQPSSVCFLRNNVCDKEKVYVVLDICFICDIVRCEVGGKEYPCRRPLLSRPSP
ncbi:hypothetical protein BDZ91DRAFT_723404 [Kalaharituber pfeilii]|nr:hypothetical protein BDZ91DRAFT_723404 [Kalaharituber pfeilii]